MADKLAYRVTEAADALGISRAKAYTLVAEGALPSIRIGASIRIPAIALQQWIERQLAERGKGGEAA